MAFPFHAALPLRTSFEGVSPWALMSKETPFFWHWILFKNLRPWTLTSKETLFFFCHRIFFKNLLYSYFLKLWKYWTETCLLQFLSLGAYSVFGQTKPILPHNIHSNNWFPTIVEYMAKIGWVSWCKIKEKVILNNEITIRRRFKGLYAIWWFWSAWLKTLRVDRLVRDLSRVLITNFEILVSESSSQCILQIWSKSFHYWFYDA